MGRSMLYCGGTRAQVRRMLRLMDKIAAASASLLLSVAACWDAIDLAYFWLRGDVGSDARGLEDGGGGGGFAGLCG